MSRRLKMGAVAFVVLIAAAQLIRPEHANPATDPSRTIAAQVGAESDLVAILDRACGDCHSNATVWPWYAEIAPLSWLMALGVAEGRKAVNFSEWAEYPREQQQGLLAAACADVASGKMPGSPWTMLHPEAALSAQDVETVCAAARAGRASPPAAR